MQADRYGTNESVHQCSWCNSEYDEAYSHARDTELFCSRKCEMEAHYWLHASLDGMPE